MDRARAFKFSSWPPLPYFMYRVIYFVSCDIRTLSTSHPLSWHLRAVLLIHNFPYPEQYVFKDDFAGTKSLTLPYLQGIPVFIFKAFDACLFSLLWHFSKAFRGRGGVTGYLALGILYRVPHIYYMIIPYRIILYYMIGCAALPCSTPRTLYEYTIYNIIQLWPRPTADYAWLRILYIHMNTPL